MLHIFFKDSIIYTIPSIVSRGLSLLLIPLYTRVLNPAEYGSLDLLMAFANLVNLTIALEVSQGVARHYAEEQDAIKKVVYASSAFWFTIFTYSLFGGIALLFSEPLASRVMGNTGMLSAFRIGILYIWLNGIFYLIQNQLRWELRSKHYAAVSMMAAFATAGIAVWFTYGLHWKLNGLIWGMAAGTSLGVIYGLWHLKHSFCYCFDFRLLRKMLAFSAPLVPSGVAVFISAYVDRLMITHFLSVNLVGHYGVGFRVAGIIGLAMLGFQGALTPLVYAHHHKTETPCHLARIFRLFMAFALWVSAFLTVFAHNILYLITTPEYYQAEQVIIFLVPAILLSQMYIFAPGIAIAKKTHLFLWINLGGAVVNTILNWWLIPILGIKGAALATFLGYLFVFTMYMQCSQKLYHIPHEWHRIGLAAVITSLVVITITLLNLGGLARYGLAFAGLLVVGFTIFLTGLIRKTELLALGRFVFDQFAQKPKNGSSSN